MIPLKYVRFRRKRTYFKANIKVDISYQEISTFMLPLVSLVFY